MKLKWAALTLLLGLGVAVAPVQGEANQRQYGERYFDNEENEWKVWRGRAGRYRSDKSPIRKKKVRIEGRYSKGTIIIDTAERRLYYTLGNGRAIKYGVGVGRQGFTWRGTQRISRKAEWPGWTPPAVMIRREARKGRKLPRYMPGGPNNPLGARALYLGSSIYRIHGTNQPWTIGHAMSSGCIRMANDDVKDLYDRVGVGTKVIVR
ncbi:MAG: L,D-transpeptidase [Pseudomonadota bacterium]